MKVWVPKLKIIESKDELLLPVGVKGRYKLATLGRYGRRRESAWFDNLILDAGLERFGNSNATHNTCVVGTGTTAPVVTDTQLETLLVSASSIQSAVNATLSSSPYGARKTWTYEFATGIAEGNLTEVGVGWGAAALFSRALIEDAGGAPTTFTVQADEILRVTYELTAYPPLADLAGSVDISGVNHNTVMRGAGVSGAGWRLSPTGNQFTFQLGTGGQNGFDHIAYDGALGAITGTPAGSFDEASFRSNIAYTPGNLYSDYSVNYGLDQANFGGGISAIMTDMAQSGTGARMRFQCSYDPAIPKDNTNVLTLNFRHSVARTP